MSANATKHLGDHQFTFVVMADTHVNQSETSSASPYPSTILTNARARWVIHAINQIAPDFVIHLGDLTNPVPSLLSYPEAVARFRDLFANLQCPIHFVPGNHDIGDKPVAWMPAKAVNDTYIDHYESSFGPTYRAFVHKGTRFVIANTPLLNSGLARESAQRAWLEADLTEHAGERTFCFTHYPIFLTTPDEASHYDNVDEPGRSWFLGLLERANVEALFTAHVHNFFYNRHVATDCYTVPAVCFVRHDYAEFFRADAAPEFARNDQAKLGFCIVNVYANGHTVHLVRSNGATIAADEALPAQIRPTFAPHPRLRAHAPLGVHLRHPWAEQTWIPATGGADEFARKLARNDYPLLSLWEMGIRNLRVPLQDLTNAQTRARLADLQRMGHAFTVYGFGIPTGDARTVLLENAHLIADFEMIINWQELDNSLAALRDIHQTARLPVTLSRLRGKDDEAGVGSSGFYFHNIRHGFRPTDPELSDPRLRRAADDGTIYGLAFHLPRHEAPEVALPAIAHAAQQLGLQASGELRMVSDNPAEAFNDDLANANRIATALVAAHATPNVTLFVDTLIDIDRGYFARTALYDRRYAPRLAGKVVKHLSAHFANLTVPPVLHTTTIEAGKGLILQTQFASAAPTWSLLVLPEPTCTISTLPFDSIQLNQQGTGRVLNLETGEAHDVTWQKTATNLHLATTITSKVPTLVTVSTQQ